MKNSKKEITPKNNEIMPIATPEVFGSMKPDEIVRKAKSIADILAPIIQKRRLFNEIQGKKFVRAEGWAFLGSMLGVFPHCSTIKLNGENITYEATCILKTLSGAEVGKADAMCSASERNWNNRDEYAIRSMAQTRAIGKAYRLPFAWILVLAGYEPTPAEEIPNNNPVGKKEVTSPKLL